MKLMNISSKMDINHSDRLSLNLTNGTKIYSMII